MSAVVRRAKGPRSPAKKKTHELLSSRRKTINWKVVGKFHLSQDRVDKICAEMAQFGQFAIALFIIDFAIAQNALVIVGKRYTDHLSSVL